VPLYLHVSVIWESVDVTVNCISLYVSNERFFGNDDEDYNGGNNSTNKITNLSTSLLILIVSEMKMLWKSLLSPLLTKLGKYHNHHHHHHHKTNKDLDHMLTYFGLTHLEIPLTVFAGLFCPLVYSCLLFSVIYHETFCLYVAKIFFIFLYFIQNELFLFLMQFLYLFLNLLKCTLLLSSHISPLLLFLLLLLLKWSNFHAGRVSVFYGFNPVFFKVFSGLNILFIMPVILKELFLWLFMSTSFS
jgi:hypothetical protein